MPGSMTKVRDLRTGDSDSEYRRETLSNRISPLEGQLLDGLSVGLLSNGPSFSSSVNCNILSTLVICVIVSAVWRIPYCSIPHKMSTCEMAKPTFPAKVFPGKERKICKSRYIVYRLAIDNKNLPSSSATKLYVTTAMKAMDTTSSAKPNDVPVATISE